MHFDLQDCNTNKTNARHCYIPQYNTACYNYYINYVTPNYQESSHHSTKLAFKQYPMNKYIQKLINIQLVYATDNISKTIAFK